MNEEQIRAIVRDEVNRILQEREETQASADYFLEEIQERRRKKEERQRLYEKEERRCLEDRIIDLEAGRR